MQGVAVQLGGQVMSVCGLNTGNSTLGTFLSILWVRFQILFMFRNKKAAAERESGAPWVAGAYGLSCADSCCISYSVSERWLEAGA